MNDHHRLGGFARGGVQHMQVGHGHLGALAVAGAKAEGVFQTALNNLVSHAHVHHVRQVVLGGGLCGCQANGRGKGTEYR